MIEVGKAFMYLGQEYRVVYIDEKKGRVNIEPVDPEINKTFKMPSIGQKIVVDNIYEFRVTYVHDGKKRISLEQRRS